MKLLISPLNIWPHVLSLAVVAALNFATWAQTSVMHKLNAITLAGDDAIELEFSGRAEARFAQLYDLFPLEMSKNLRDWEPLGLVTRTNALTARTVYVGERSVSAGATFFRTPTNILVTPFPPLTGPFTVGTEARLLTDPSRVNAARGTNHQFMISIFYPAEPKARTLPQSYWEMKAAAKWQWWYGIPIESSWVSRSFAGLDLRREGGPFPVIFYSPSFNATRRENLYKLEELASHGFVVVAVDHLETFASVWPDGSVVEGPPSQVELSSLVESLRGRADDVRVALAELTRMNTEEAAWQGRLDLEKVGAFGFSLGGATAAELCRTDARFKAGAGMDGIFVMPEIRDHPLQKPFLMLRADEDDVVLEGGLIDDRFSAIDAMQRDGYFVQIAGTIHWSFTDVPLLTSRSVFEANYGKPRQTALRPARINQLSARFLVAFFNKTLRGMDDGTLNGPAASEPEVIRFVRK